MTDRPSSRRYDVHLFAVVRLDVADVEAASQREAVERALERVDLSARLAGPGFEYADELSHFLVDEVGDEQHGAVKVVSQPGRAAVGQPGPAHLLV